MINISKPLIEKEEIQAVVEVLNSGHIVQGKEVEKLEKEFTKLTKTKFAVATNSGTSALHTALYSIGVGESDEVITTPFTFVATANSILMAGAKPVFVDIDEKTFNIDPNKIEEKITKKTKAILVVNIFGKPADYKAIKRIAKKHKLVVVEDAAQSIGAFVEKRPSGSLGDIACFSLYATKNILTGEGGMITTSNKIYYQRAKLFRNHGQDENKRYFYKDLGFNYRLMDLAAAIGNQQLKKIKKITKLRKQNAKRYNSEFKKVKGLILPDLEGSVVHQYTLRITSDFKLSRDRFKKFLESKDIQSNIYYPIPLYRFDHLKFGNKSEHFPVSELISQQVISIPVHPSLTKKEADYIIETIKEI